MGNGARPKNSDLNSLTQSLSTALHLRTRGFQRNSSLGSPALKQADVDENPSTTACCWWDMEQLDLIFSFHSWIMHIPNYNSHTKL
jgi:hypothetical protein